MRGAFVFLCQLYAHFAAESISHYLNRPRRAGLSPTYLPCVTCRTSQRPSKDTTVEQLACLPYDEKYVNVHHAERLYSAISLLTITLHIDTSL